MAPTKQFELSTSGAEPEMAIFPGRGSAPVRNLLTSQRSSEAQFELVYEIVCPRLAYHMTQARSLRVCTAPFDEDIENASDEPQCLPGCNAT